MMPPSDPSRRRINPSVFDRLTDREPRSKTDLPTTHWDQLRDLKQAVARDLTDLLNTRRSEADVPEEFEQTNRSVAAFGIQDFTAGPVDPEIVRRAIEKSVRIFEPRLSHIHVRVSETANFRLGFRIEATLHIDVRTEVVMFDAAVPTDSKRFEVRESR
jgi:type VI secretion system protein ImpF